MLKDKSLTDFYNLFATNNFKKRWHNTTSKSRPWFRKLYLFYKILHSKSPSYLSKLLPENNNPYALRSVLNSKFLSSM